MVVVVVLLWDTNPSGDSEMKVGFGRRDRDSNCDLLPCKPGESDRTDLVVGILHETKDHKFQGCRKQG